MSRSPYFFVERYDSTTKKYELQHPLVWNYNHTERIPAELFPYNGCHDLFSIVEKRQENYPEMHGIHLGLPTDVCQEILDVIYNEDEDDDCWGVDVRPRWFTYADMYIYLLKHPKVAEYNDNGEEVMVDNPVKALKERVDAFLEVMDWWDWEDDYSRIRIVYWIS